MATKDKALNGSGLSRLISKIKNLVKPNETLAGTEPELTSITIDGVKYKVANTTTIYQSLNNTQYGGN